jgi:membrane associated rhomboid family serine protease
VARVVNKHQSWRLISCIWLHAGVFHVVANMLSLLLIGIRLEQEFGFCMYFASVVNFVQIIYLSALADKFPRRLQLFPRGMCLRMCLR